MVDSEQGGDFPARRGWGPVAAALRPRLLQITPAHGIPGVGREDLVQEAITRFLARDPELRGEAEVGAYLVTTLFNLINGLAKMKTYGERPIDPSVLATLPDTREDAVTHDRYHGLSIEDVRSAAQDLKEPFRQVFFAFHFDHHKLARIARDTGRKLTVVGVQVYRARRKVREILVARGLCPKEQP